MFGNILATAASYLTKLTTVVDEFSISLTCVIDSGGALVSIDGYNVVSPVYLVRIVQANTISPPKKHGINNDRNTTYSRFNSFAPAIILLCPELLS
jgi:hypothetical protein